MVELQTRRPHLYYLSLLAVVLLVHLAALALVPGGVQAAGWAGHPGVALTHILLWTLSVLLLLWRFRNQSVRGFLLLASGLFFANVAEATATFSNLTALVIGGRAIAITDVGRLICAICFALGADKMNDVYPRRGLIRCIGMDLFMVLMGAASLLGLMLLLPMTHTVLYYSTNLIFFAAVCLFFLAFYRSGQRIHFWFSMTALLWLFATILSRKPDLYPEAMSELYWLDSLLAFSALLVGLLDGQAHWQHTEKQLRGELERSLFRAQASIQNSETLLTAGGVGQGRIDAGGRVIEANPALLSLLGRGLSEVKGLPFTGLFESQYVPTIKRAEAAWRQGRTGRFDAAVQRQRETSLFCNVTVLPIMAGRKFSGASFGAIDLSTWRDAEEALGARVKALDETAKSVSAVARKAEEELAENKAFHAAVMAAVDVIVIVIDTKGRCVYLNEFGMSVLDYQAEELARIKVPAFFRDIGKVRAAYGSAMKVELKDYVHTWKVKSRPPVVCTWDVRQLCNISGKRIGVLGVGNLHKDPGAPAGAGKKDPKASESEQRFGEILAAAKSFTQDGKAGSFLAAICSWAQGLGWQSVALVFREFDSDRLTKMSSAGPAINPSVLDQLSKGQIRKLTSSAVQVGSGFKIEQSARQGKNPADLWLLPITVAHKEMGWLVCSLSGERTWPNRDRMRQLEQLSEFAGALLETVQQLNHSVAEVAELHKTDEIKTAFLARISHELRSPLNSILAIAESLLLQRPEAEAGDLYRQIQLIRQNGSTLLHLTNELLEMMRLDAGGAEVAFTYFSIDSLVQSCLSTFKPLSQEKNLKMTAKILKDVPQRVFGDKAKMVSILNNFISNAVKFTQAGSVSLKVSAEKKQTSIRFSVDDTGIGLSSKKLAVIFQEYRQLESSTKSKTAGSGLGLAIAQKHAHLLGGKIDVTSKKGKGSRFEAVFPLSKMGEVFVIGRVPRAGDNGVSDTQEAVNIPEPAPAEARRPVSGKATPPCVLLIDDDVGGLQATKFSLEEAGFSVLFSEDGETAIKMALKEQPQVILMDMVMPGLGGLAATKKLKRLKRTRDIPIIATTARAGPAEKKEALAAGCDDYLIKPFAIEGLIERIERQINMRHPLPKSIDRGSKN